MSNQNKRLKKFNELKTIYGQHPLFNKIKDLYLDGEIKTISSAEKRLKDIKYKKNGEIYKTSSSKLEKFNIEYKAYSVKYEKEKYKIAMDKSISFYIKKFGKKYKYTKYEIEAIRIKLLSGRFICTLKLDTFPIRKIIFTINADNIGYFIYWIQNLTYDFFDVAAVGSVSDQGGGQGQINILSIKVELFVKDAKFLKVKENKNSAFFRYLNLSKLDLSKYQIVDSSMSEDEINQLTKEQCLLYVLKQYNISEAEINSIKLSFNSFFIPKIALNKICDIIKKKIILYTHYNREKFELLKQVYGKSYEDVIEIATYKEHYFKYEKTLYSKYFIDNYEKLKDVKNCNSIVKINQGKYYIYDESKKCSSLYLINKFMENGLFKKDDSLINKIVSSVSYENENIPLDNIENEQQLSNGEIKEKDKYDIFYADCESVVKYETHEVIMLGIVKETEKEPFIVVRRNRDDKKIFIKKFFDYIKKNKTLSGVSIVYFHNLKYDWLGLLQGYIVCESQCKKENILYSVKVNYFGLKVEFRDSMKLINIGLAKFSDTFGLECNKQEAIAYEYYDFDNIHASSVDVDEYKSHLKTEKDKETFLKILNQDKELFSFDGLRFNAVAYYKYYLKYDCLVLQQGINKYVDIIKKVTSTNGKTPLFLHDSLTISSLTNKYMKMNGAFDDCYELQHNLREYVSKAIYGGRVNVCPEYKKKIINDKINDMDAISLYPSAINRMCSEIGIPTGKAKKIETFNMDYKYFVCRIKLTKINKKQQNPFIAIKTKDCINYVNHIDEPVVIYVDKITLQDYIKFHEIEYDFIDGVYWNETYNKKMGELIRELFSSRLEYKRLMKLTTTTKSEKSGYNVLQEIVKLMMNSSYGKTIIKKSNVETAYVKNGENNINVNSYIYNNFNTIKEFNKINDSQTEIKKLKLDDSFNLAHVGCLILSYSKRIMNEVMSLASDNKIDIYYQDTDSMHLKDRDIKPLRDLYFNKYNRELIGTNLGQFHSDFNLKNAAEGAEVYAVKSCFLGKKSYIDVLESKNKDGEIINGYHLRMKGIPDASLKYAAEKDFGGDYYKLYEFLSTGKEYEFILNPYDYKVSFQYLQGGGIRTRQTQEFKRVVKF
jgi:hypothetical protein